MTVHNLEWEEGYRSAIEVCLATMLLSGDHKKIWKYLSELHEDSAIRTDRLLDRM